MGVIRSSRARLCTIIEIQDRAVSRISCSKYFRYALHCLAFWNLAFHNQCDSARTQLPPVYLPAWEWASPRCRPVITMVRSGRVKRMLLSTVPCVAVIELLFLSVVVRHTRARSIAEG